MHIGIFIKNFKNILYHQFQNSKTDLIRDDIKVLQILKCQRQIRFWSKSCRMVEKCNYWWLTNKWIIFWTFFMNQCPIFIFISWQRKISWRQLGSIKKDGTSFWMQFVTSIMCKITIIIFLNIWTCFDSLWCWKWSPPK